MRQLAFCESHSVKWHSVKKTLNRTQILGALILAAFALVALLLRWKLAH